MGQLVDERALVLHRGDAAEFGLQRTEALGFHRLLVHARAVEVANFLVDRIAPCTAGCGFLQNAALNILVALVELDEAYPLRLIGRDLGILDPVAAGILIEIHARIDALVDVVEAKAGRRLGGSGLTGSKSTKAAHSHQKQKDR